jgi:hypothetical protein
MAPGVDAVAAGLDAVHGDAVVLEEGVEQAHGIGAAAHAGDQRIGQPAELLQRSAARLAADYGVEIAHQHRIRVRAGHGADDVEGVVDIGHPVAHASFMASLSVREPDSTGITSRRAGFMRKTLGFWRSTSSAPMYTPRTPAPAGRHGGGGHAVLAGAGLGDDPGLAHALGQQAWPMVLFTLCAPVWLRSSRLSQDPRPAELVRPSLRQVERRRAAHVMGQVVIEFGLEVRVVAKTQIGLLQIVQGEAQGLRDEPAAIGAEVAGSRVRSLNLLTKDTS